MKNRDEVRAAIQAERDAATAVRQVLKQQRDDLVSDLTNCSNETERLRAGWQNALAGKREVEAALRELFDAINGVELTLAADDAERLDAAQIKAAAALGDTDGN